MSPADAVKNRRRDNEPTILPSQWFCAFFRGAHATVTDHRDTVKVLWKEMDRVARYCKA
jgi:hypothetical protein